MNAEYIGVDESCAGCKFYKEFKTFYYASYTYAGNGTLTPQEIYGRICTCRDFELCTKRKKTRKESIE